MPKRIEVAGLGFVVNCNTVSCFADDCFFVCCFRLSWPSLLISSNTRSTYDISFKFNQETMLCAEISPRPSHVNGGKLDTAGNRRLRP